MNRSGHLRRARLPARVRKGLLIGLFVLLTLANAFWLIAFSSALIADPSDIDGDAVTGFVVSQLILVCLWVPLFLRVWRLRVWRLRAWRLRARGRGRHGLPAMRFGRHERAARPLTEADFRAALRLPGRKRNAEAGVVFQDDGPLARLASAEQALGNALYQLDLRRDSHGLSREWISALRVTGVEASAWLTSDGPSARNVRDGVRRYLDLAKETENFLIGTASAQDVDRARDRLVQLTTRSWR